MFISLGTALLHSRSTITNLAGEPVLSGEFNTSDFWQVKLVNAMELSALVGVVSNKPVPVIAEISMVD